MDVNISRPEFQEMAADVEQYVGPGASQYLAMGGGAYEAASRTDRAMATWYPPIRSADADSIPDKPLTDARVADMVRNDGHVQAGDMLHRDNIVGSMYMLNARPATMALGLDEVWEEEFQQEVETKFDLWAESLNNWVDAARTNTFTGMVRLAVGTYSACGETLSTAEWMRDQPRPFRTAIQMIDVARLSNPMDADTLTQRVRGGVLQDRYGAPRGYYIRNAHPTDYDRMDAWDHTFVPARKPWGRLQVIHIKEQRRIDQTRGVADIVAGLKACKITKQFRDVTLQNAVVGAMYAASIESELPTEAIFQSLGAGNVSTPGQAAGQYAGEYLSAISAYAGNSKHMMMDGVRIPHFFPGTKLQLRPVATPGGVGQDFENSLIRYIAATLGVSYEQLSKDYTKTNYSSARAAMTETWKFMMSRKRMVADRFASSIYRLWMEEAINRKLITSLPRNAPNWYEGLNADAYCGAEWIGAARGQIDELKETQAAALRIKNGLSTHEDELAKLGKDWRRVYKQLAREQAEQKRLGVEFFQDNSMNAASGTPSDATTPDAAAN